MDITELENLSIPEANHTEELFMHEQLKKIRSRVPELSEKEVKGAYRAVRLLNTLLRRNSGTTPAVNRSAQDTVTSPLKQIVDTHTDNDFHDVTISSDTISINGSTDYNPNESNDELSSVGSSEDDDLDIMSNKASQKIEITEVPEENFLSNNANRTFGHSRENEFSIDNRQVLNSGDGNISSSTESDEGNFKTVYQPIDRTVDPVHRNTIGLASTPKPVYDYQKSNNSLGHTPTISTVTENNDNYRSNDGFGINDNLNSQNQKHFEVNSSNETDNQVNATHRDIKNARSNISSDSQHTRIDEKIIDTSPDGITSRNVSLNDETKIDYGPSDTPMSFTESTFENNIIGDSFTKHAYRNTIADQVNQRIADKNVEDDALSLYNDVSSSVSQSVQHPYTTEKIWNSTDVVTKFYDSKENSYFTHEFTESVDHKTSDTDDRNITDKYSHTSDGNTSINQVNPRTANKDFEEDTFSLYNVFSSSTTINENISESAELLHTTENVWESTKVVTKFHDFREDSFFTPEFTEAITIDYKTSDTDDNNITEKYTSVSVQSERNEERENFTSPLHGPSLEGELANDDLNNRNEYNSSITELGSNSTDYEDINFTENRRESSDDDATNNAIMITDPSNKYSNFSSSFEPDSISTTYDNKDFTFNTFKDIRVDEKYPSEEGNTSNNRSNENYNTMEHRTTSIVLFDDLSGEEPIYKSSVTILEPVENYTSSTEYYETSKSSTENTESSTTLNAIDGSGESRKEEPSNYRSNVTDLSNSVIDVSENPHTGNPDKQNISEEPAFENFYTNEDSENETNLIINDNGYGNSINHTETFNNEKLESIRSDLAISQENMSSSAESRTVIDDNNTGLYENLTPLYDLNINDNNNHSSLYNLSYTTEIVSKNHLSDPESDERFPQDDLVKEISKSQKPEVSDLYDEEISRFSEPINFITSTDTTYINDRWFDSLEFTESHQRNFSGLDHQMEQNYTSEGSSESIQIGNETFELKDISNNSQSHYDGNGDALRSLDTSTLNSLHTSDVLDSEDEVSGNTFGIKEYRTESYYDSSTDQTTLYTRDENSMDSEIREDSKESFLFNDGKINNESDLRTLDFDTSTGLQNEKQEAVDNSTDSYRISSFDDDLPKGLLKENNLSQLEELYENTTDEFITTSTSREQANRDDPFTRRSMLLNPLELHTEGYDVVTRFNVSSPKSIFDYDYDMKVEENVRTTSTDVSASSAGAYEPITDGMKRDHSGTTRLIPSKTLSYNNDSTTQADDSVTESLNDHVNFNYDASSSPASFDESNDNTIRGGATSRGNVTTDGLNDEEISSNKSYGDDNVLSENFTSDVFRKLEIEETTEVPSNLSSDSSSKQTPNESIYTILTNDSDDGGFDNDRQITTAINELDSSIDLKNEYVLQILSEMTESTTTESNKLPATSSQEFFTTSSVTDNENNIFPTIHPTSILKSVNITTEKEPSFESTASNLDSATDATRIQFTSLIHLPAYETNEIDDNNRDEITKDFANPVRNYFVVDQTISVISATRSTSELDEMTHPNVSNYPTKKGNKSDPQVGTDYKINDKYGYTSGEHENQDSKPSINDQTTLKASTTDYPLVINVLPRTSEKILKGPIPDIVAIPTNRPEEEAAGFKFNYRSEIDSDEGFIPYLSPVSRHHSQNLPLPSPSPIDLRRSNCARVSGYSYSRKRRYR